MNIGRGKTQSGWDYVHGPYGRHVKVAVLASGGKDSTYSSWWAMMQGWDIEALVTLVITGDDSMMFQVQNTAVAGLQASAMGVPWIPIASEGEEVIEVQDLEDAIRGLHNPNAALEKIWPKEFRRPEEMKIKEDGLEIDGLIVGALRSDYQKTNIEMMCERLGIRSYCPLWHNDSFNHMSSLIEHGFEVVFTSVSCEGMDSSWLGRVLDKDSLLQLSELSTNYRFNLDGEGGEFETIVTDAPHFERSIFCNGEALWEGSRGTWSIKKCELSGNR